MPCMLAFCRLTKHVQLQASNEDAFSSHPSSRFCCSADSSRHGFTTSFHPEGVLRDMSDKFHYTGKLCSSLCAQHVALQHTAVTKLHSGTRGAGKSLYINDISKCSFGVVNKSKVATGAKKNTTYLSSSITWQITIVQNLFCRHLQKENERNQRNNSTKPHM